MIVLYKTAYYSFYLPVALAMHMCGIPHPSAAHSPSPAAKSGEADPYAHALSILLPLGEYFQIQDDFLDYAGTEAQIGKIGTDILDNKCSWCINVALSRATPEQRAILDANYGRKDAACEARVKQVYEDVGLREIYEEYERQSYGRVEGLIRRLPEARSPNGVLRGDVFRAFLEKIYKRTK